MKKTLLLLIIILLPVFVFSQFTFMAEVRPRLYVDNGYKNPDNAISDTKIYLTQRSGLACRYQNKNIEAYVHFRDARVWGDDNMYSTTGQNGNSNTVAIHQSWINIHTKKDLSIKIGRQLLVYDDERVLSARNWNDFQVTYDAIKLRYQYKNSSLDAVFSWNNKKKASEFFPCQRIRSNNLIHYNYGNEKNNVSILLLLTGKMENDTLSGIIWKNTLGTGYSYLSETWQFDFNIYLQNNIEKPDYCISFRTGRDIGNWGLGCGTDILSGSKKGTSGFDILYGKRHGYYGYMDYFNTTPENGLIDIMLKSSWQQSQKLLLSFYLHQFNYQYKPDNRMRSTSLGQELDIILKYQYLQKLTIQPGYSIFLPTETFEREKGAIHGLGLQHFFYLTISGKFNSQR